MLMQSLDTNALVTTVKSSKPGSSASPIRTEDVNNDIPYIGPNDEIDPTILSMAGMNEDAPSPDPQDFE